MKSKYLSKADIEPGDIVIPDGQTDNPVTVLWIGRIYARVRAASGYEWSLMRNRLTPLFDASPEPPGRA